MSILRYFITSKAKRKVLRLFLEDIETPYYTREVARLVDEPLNAVRRELGHLEKAGLLSSYMQGNQKYHRVTADFPLLHEWRKIILETPDAVVKPQVIASGAAARQSHQPPKKSAVSSSEATKQPSKPETAPGAPEPVSEPPSVIARSEATKQAQPLTVPALNEYLRSQFQDLSGIAIAIIHGQSAMQEEIPAEGVDLLVVSDMDNDALTEFLVGVEDETGVRINLVRMTRSDFDYRNAKGDPLIRKIWSEKKLVVKGRH